MDIGNGPVQLDNEGATDVSSP